jgi:hypothetical protein
MWNADGTSLTNSTIYESGGVGVAQGPANNWAFQALGGYGLYAVASYSGGYGVQGIGGSSGWGGVFSGGNGINVNTTGSGISVTAGSGSWAGSFTGGYGVYVANNAGYYTQLDNSSYGVLTNGTINSGSISSSGSVTATAFYYSSDERLKHNIQPLADPLSKILQLQPVTFNWNDSRRGTTTQIGFIAQAVEKVVPELVSTDASTTIKAVDYARVTPLLVGAAQEQEQKIEEQQQKLEAQQKEIDELKAAVEALKSAQH